QVGRENHRGAASGGAPRIADDPGRDWRTISRDRHHDYADDSDTRVAHFRSGLGSSLASPDRAFTFAEHPADECVGTAGNLGSVRIHFSRTANRAANHWAAAG